MKTVNSIKQEEAHELGLKSLNEILMASKEDLEKCKTKNLDLSQALLDKIYYNLGKQKGVEFKNAYD